MRTRVLTNPSKKRFSNHEITKPTTSYHLNTLRPRQNGRHLFPRRHFQMHFLEWKSRFEFRIQFDWRLFLRVQLTIIRHWFRPWLGAQQATNHYLNQWWPSSLTHICATRAQWVNGRFVDKSIHGRLVTSVPSLNLHFSPSAGHLSYSDSRTILIGRGLIKGINYEKVTERLFCDSHQNKLTDIHNALSCK